MKICFYSLMFFALSHVSNLFSFDTKLALHFYGVKVLEGQNVTYTIDRKFEKDLNYGCGQFVKWLSDEKSKPIVKKFNLGNASTIDYDHRSKWCKMDLERLTISTTGSENIPFYVLFEHRPNENKTSEITINCKKTAKMDMIKNFHCENSTWKGNDREKENDGGQFWVDLTKKKVIINVKFDEK